MSGQWKQFVQLFAEKNPQLTKQQVLQQAKKPFRQLKKYFSQRGGATVNEYIKFLLGVDNPNQNNMPDMLACSDEQANPDVLTKFNSGRTFVEVDGLSPNDPNVLQVSDLLKESHRQGYRMSNARLLDIFQHKYVWGLCKEFYSQTDRVIDDDVCRTLVARIIRNSDYLKKIGVIYIRFKIIAEYQSSGNKLFAGESINTLTDNLQAVFLVFINIILSYKPEHIVNFSDATILTDLHNLRSCGMVRRIFSFYRDKETPFGWGIVSMGNSIQTIITNGATYIDRLYDYAITKLYSFGENLLRLGTSKEKEASPYDPEETLRYIAYVAAPAPAPAPAPAKKLISDELKKRILYYLRNVIRDSTQRTDAELIYYLKKSYSLDKGVLWSYIRQQTYIPWGISQSESSALYAELTELARELDKLLE